MWSIDSDIQAFKVFLADQSLSIFNEHSIDHGYQIIVTDGLFLRLAVFLFRIKTLYSRQNLPSGQNNNNCVALSFLVAITLRQG